MEKEPDLGPKVSLQENTGPAKPENSVAEEKTLDKKEETKEKKSPKVLVEETKIEVKPTGEKAPSP